VKKILIVEDEPAHLKTIAQYLLSDGKDYEIISAGNGKNAIEITRAEMPDLIVMDWELPVMNGIEVTKRIKTDAQTFAIPIIMCTGVMLTSNDLQTAFDAGAIDYIRKPVDRIELTARVRSMLMLADYFSKKNIAENKIISLTQELQENEINRLNAEIEFKNKEITAKAMFLIQKDELINKSIEKLSNLSKSTHSEILIRVKELITELKVNLKDERWREFETYFEKVHEAFYSNLNKKFPDLTPNEKKLCAFLKLNLSTKEICALTQQSLKSVEIARTRLRQKLNLVSTDNLTAFISSI
jgi:DNA-binding response OmpR family regulator/DNA-binding CsgD family transcriptional regulator